MPTRRILSPVVIPCGGGLRARWVCITLSALLLAGCILGLDAERAQGAGNLDRAKGYFEEARKAHATLQKISMDKRTIEGYAKLIEIFRRVYLAAPNYGNSTISLMAIGELSEEMARRWSEPRYFQQAMDAYAYLLREYPQSQFRFDARLAIARIYRQDLMQPEKALEQFERYLADYPNSAQSKLARQAVIRLRDEIGAVGLVIGSGEPGLSARPVSAPVESATAEKGADVAASSGPPAPSAAKEELVSITDLRYWTNAGSSRVVVDVGQKVKFESGQLSNPPRLYIDLHETKIPRPAGGRTLEVNSELLKRVRLAQFDKRVSRLVLDLGKETDFEISEMTNPYRLVIDVRGRVSEIDAAIPAASPAELATSAKPASVAPGAAAVVLPAQDAASGRAAGVKAEAPSTSSGGAAAAVESGGGVAPVETAKTEPALADARTPQPPVAERPVANAPLAESPVAEPPVAEPKMKAAAPIRGGLHSLTRALGLKIGRIFIDAGHGGHDTGTIGPSGLTEKELALDLSERLGKMIEEKLGSEVILSRVDDSFVPLEARVARANDVEADLFLSIHLNSSAAQNATGIETYYLNFTSDPEALKVAARENAGAQETIANLQGIVRKIALQEKLDESKEFARRVQAELRKSLAKGLSRARANQFDRGVKTAPFVVLIGANMPSVLAEVSFLSNAAEEKRLKTPEHRQKIAEALFAGVNSYVETLSGVKVAPKQPPMQQDKDKLAAAVR